MNGPEPVLEIDSERRQVVWRVRLSQPFVRLQTPWGVLWRGREVGAGVEAWVEAHEGFELIMEGEAMTLFEVVTPGRHRYLLTVLDSTDVA
jgi:hypothetical protein